MVSSVDHRQVTDMDVPALFDKTQRLVQSLAYRVYSRANHRQRETLSFEDVYAEACAKWAAVVRDWDPGRGALSTLLTTAIMNHLNSYMEKHAFYHRRPLIAEVATEEGFVNVFDRIEGAIDPNERWESERRVQAALELASPRMREFLAGIEDGESLVGYVDTCPHHTPEQRERIQKKQTREIRQALAREAAELRRRTGVTVKDLAAILWA